MNARQTLQKIWQHRTASARLLAQRVRQSLSFVVMPGSHGMPLYDVLMLFFKSCFEGRLIDRAAAVAFNFFLALFPLILFAFTLIPYLPVANLQARLFAELNNVLPPGTFDWVYTTIDDIMRQPHEKLMSVSIVLSFFFGSSGISAIFDGFKNSVLDNDYFSWIKQRLHAMLTLAIIGLCILLSIVFISIGGNGLSAVMHLFHVDGQIIFMLLNFFRWVIAILFIMFSISLLYHFGNAENTKYQFFTPGSCLATGLFIVATIGFNIYISHFASYNALYGSIGTLIVLMMWMWIVSMVVLCGNDLNISIQKLKKDGTVHAVTP